VLGCVVPARVPRAPEGSLWRCGRHPEKGTFRHLTACEQSRCWPWSASTTARRARSTALLKFGPLVGLGKISYGLYLWHVPILNYVGGGGPIVTLLLTFVAVLFSYRYVELPIHRLKARIGGSRAMGSSPLRALEPSTPTQIVPRVVTPTAAPEP
jgi:hypothetical protein